MVRVVRLAQDAERSCECPIPGNFQDQVGWGSVHPGLVEGVLAQTIFMVPSNTNYSMINILCVLPHIYTPFMIITAPFWVW